MSSVLRTPRKHIVPTHLNVPDAVLTLWSFSLTARQLLLLLACYQYAGRSLEVWTILLLRYALRPKRYVWRTIRTTEAHLYPLVPAVNDVKRKEESR